MATKKAEVKRVRMSEEQVNKYLKAYGQKHDLKGKEFDHAIRHCAATRWAALERWTAKHAKPAKVKKAAKAKPVKLKKAA